MRDTSNLQLFAIVCGSRAVALAEAKDGRMACRVAAGVVDCLDDAGLSARQPTKGERCRWAVERSDVGIETEARLAAIPL